MKLQESLKKLVESNKKKIEKLQTNNNKDTNQK